MRKPDQLNFPSSLRLTCIESACNMRPFFNPEMQPNLFGVSQAIRRLYQFVKDIRYSSGISFVIGLTI